MRRIYRYVPTIVYSSRGVLISSVTPVNNRFALLYLLSVCALIDSELVMAFSQFFMYTYTVVLFYGRVDVVCSYGVIVVLWREEA